jgi:hypothetical protein
MNDLELFIKAIEDYFKYKGIFEGNKNFLLTNLHFPRIEKKED